MFALGRSICTITAPSNTETVTPTGSEISWLSEEGRIHPKISLLVPWCMRPLLVNAGGHVLLSWDKVTAETALPAWCEVSISTVCWWIVFVWAVWDKGVVREDFAVRPSLHNLSFMHESGAVMGFVGSAMSCSCGPSVGLNRSQRISWYLVCPISSILRMLFTTSAGIVTLESRSKRWPLSSANMLPPRASSASATARTSPCGKR